MSEVKFHPGLPLIRASDDCLLSNMHLYREVWNADWQQILFRLFFTDSFLQWVSIKCTAQDTVIFHPFVSFHMLNKNLQTLWVYTKSCFTTCIIKAPMKLKLLVLYCLYSCAHWFLHLFPLRFHQQQQQNWFFVGLILLLSSSLTWLLEFVTVSRKGFN